MHISHWGGERFRCVCPARSKARFISAPRLMADEDVWRVAVGGAGVLAGIYDPILHRELTRRFVRKKRYKHSR